MHTIMMFLAFICSMPRRTPRLGMALVKTGGGVTDIRGSIGGTTFSRNKYGAYARTRTVPVNPKTVAQTKVRSVVASMIDIWKNTLTAAQRAAWAVYAANVPVLNRLGDSVNLSGWNMFCRTNSALLYNDFLAVADAPTDYTLGEQDPTLSIAVSEATQLMTITFDDSMDWCGEDDAHLLVYASRPQNVTVNFFAGPYQLAGTLDGDTAVPISSPLTMAVPFAVVAGQKLFVQCRIVRADGRLSEPFRVLCTVGA